MKNLEKFVTDVMDLLKRHEMLTDKEAPQSITIELLAPFEAEVIIRY